MHSNQTFLFCREYLFEYNQMGMKCLKIDICHLFIQYFEMLSFCRSWKFCFKSSHHYIHICCCTLVLHIFNQPKFQTWHFSILFVYLCMLKKNNVNVCMSLSVFCARIYFWYCIFIWINSVLFFLNSYQVDGDIWFFLGNPVVIGHWSILSTVKSLVKDASNLQT